MLRAVLRDDEVVIVDGREVPEVAIVGPFPIPPRNRPFPLFRSPMLPDPITGEIPFWTLWDEQRKWRVRQLTEAQRDLPLGGMPSHPLFIEQIVSGWQPRDDPPPLARPVLPDGVGGPGRGPPAAVSCTCKKVSKSRGAAGAIAAGSLSPERQWLATAYGGAPPPAAWVAALEAELAAKSERELRAELAAAEQADAGGGAETAGRATDAPLPLLPDGSGGRTGGNTVAGGWVHGRSGAPPGQRVL